MSSNAGSTTPSAERAAACARVALVTHGRPGRSATASSGSVAVAASEGVELLVAEDEASRHGLALHGDPARGGARRRARRRRDDAARAAHVPRHGDPGDRRQLRAGRLPQLDRAGGARGRAAAGVRRRARGRRAADARGRDRRVERTSPSTTSSSRRGELGRMVELEWAVGGEDLGRVPCDGLICSTPVRLDRLQPLERRAGADVGDRRDGDDVRRAALAPRAAARRAPRRRTSSSGTGRRTSRSSCSSTATASARRAATSASRPARRAAVAPRDAARGDVRQPLPRELLDLARRGQVWRHGARRLRSRRASPPADREPRPHPRGGARARARAHRAHRRDRRRARRSSRRRSGSCSARRATRPPSAPPAREAYVEAELDVPDGFFDEEGLEALRELRPGRRARARRRPPRLRRRALAGVRLGPQRRARGSRRRDRPAARAVGAVRAAAARAPGVPARPARRLRRRRPARPSRRGRATPGARSPRRRAASRSSSAAPTRSGRGSTSSRALVEDTEGLEPGEEEALRAERERMRHVAELGEGRGRRGRGDRPGRRRRRPRPRRGGGARARAARAARARARGASATSCATSSSA